MDSYLLVCLFLGLFTVCTSVCTMVEFFFGKSLYFPSYFQYKSVMKLYYPNHKCTYKEYKFLFLPKMENDISNSVYSTIDRIIYEVGESIDYEIKK